MIKGALAARAEALLAERRPFVYATVVRAAHPTSVRPGDAAIVLADGTIEGFVGGTCAQASVRVHSAHALETGAAVLLRLEPGAGPEDVETADGVVVAHNPCLSGGALEVFLEPQLPAPRILVAGDTPIARALAEVARAAGYDVLHRDTAEAAPRAGDTALVVASHGIDEERALVRALEAGIDYVGLVASETRGKAVRDGLDVSDELRARVRTPAGLAIGARSPGEVAISILAELIAAGVEVPALDAPGAGRSVAPRTPAIAVDPICGMEVVATDASIHLDVGGERVYFCCDGCRDTYQARGTGDAVVG